MNIEGKDIGEAREFEAIRMIYIYYLYMILLIPNYELLNGNKYNSWFSV